MVLFTDVVGQKLNVLPRVLKESHSGLSVPPPRRAQILIHGPDMAAALLMFGDQAVDACRRAPDAPLTRQGKEVSLLLGMMTTVSETPKELEHLLDGPRIESGFPLGLVGRGGEALQDP
jgi:hypothetical protein